MNSLNKDEVMNAWAVYEREAAQGLLTAAEDMWIILQSQQDEWTQSLDNEIIDNLMGIQYG